MVLEFLKDEFQLFPHSREYQQGRGQIRTGQSTVVVAQDGSGDFDTIEEALAASPAGSEIFVKEGTYNTAGLTISKNNIKLRGSGQGTIIHSNLTGSANPIISVTGQNVHISFLKLTRVTSASFAIEGVKATGINCSVENINAILNGTSNDTGVLFQANNCTLIDSVVQVVLVSEASKSVVTGCVLTDSTNQSSLTIDTNSFIDNNYFETMVLQGNNNCISNCYSEAAVSAIQVEGNNNLISNCGFNGVKFGLIISGDKNNVSNINIELEGTSTNRGMKISGTNNTVTNVFSKTTHASQYAYELTAASVTNMIFIWKYNGTGGGEIDNGTGNSRFYILAG